MTEVDALDRFTVDDIGAVVVGERTDRDLDLTDGKHRDVGGVAVETADLLTVDVQVQMALAIDIVAVDIRGGERHAVDRDQGVVARLRILHDLDRHLRRVACPRNLAGITMAVCTVIVRRHIDGHHGDDRLAVDGIGAVVVGRVRP